MTDARPDLPAQPTTTADPLDAVGYAAALHELEAILVELESTDVDIDRLSTQVRRAAELLELCRGRLDQAQAEVTRILVEVERGDDLGDDEPGDEGEPGRDDRDEALDRR